MNKKNILFISSWFPNKLESHNGNFVQRHAESVSTIHHVEVLHSIGDKNQSEKFLVEEQVINGIRTVIIYYKNTNNPFVNFMRRMSAYRKGFKKMKKPDLVHANVLHNSMLFAVWLKKRLNIPFVITEHWTAFQKENAMNAPKKVLRTAKIIGNHASFVMPVSKNLQQGLINIGIKSPMRTIPNVVDTNIFDIIPSENTVPKFLHISSLIPRKRVDAIINVAKKLHDEGYLFTLEVGGDGDYESVQNQINKLKAQEYISTFGAISYKEVANKMQNSDCFVLFSESETQGCVLLESFACGVPVISSKVGGVPEIVPKDFGILVEKNNEEELYNAMISFIEKKESIKSPEMLRKFVINGFSRDAITQQFNEVYSKVLEK